MEEPLIEKVKTDYISMSETESRLSCLISMGVARSRGATTGAGPLPRV